MENFWDYNVWATLNVIAVLLLSLLAANMIKKANKEITSMVITAAEKLVRQATTSEAFDEFLETAKRGEGNE